MQTIFLFFIIGMLYSCGKSGSDSAAPLNTPFESLTVTLTDNSGDSISAEPPEPCEVDVGFGLPDSGICTTPLQVKGWASNIFLHQNAESENTAFDNGTSLLAQGTGLNVAGEWEGGAFDFSESGGIDGDSDLEKAYKTKPSFTSLSIELNYINFKTQIGSNYWNVIIPFYSQPVEQNAIVQSCQYDEIYLSKVAQNANLLPGLEFERGDFLFCIKSTLENCNLSDFKFFDTTSETFVSTRPNAPKFSEFIAESEAGCAPPIEGEKTAQLNWGRFSLRVQLETPLKLYADYAFGSSSQVPDDVAASSGLPPYKIYFYEVDGLVQKGNDLNLTFDLNTNEMIFFKDMPDIATLQNSSDAEIASKIIFQSLYQTEADPTGANTTPALSANPSVVLQTLSTEQLQKVQ